MFKVICLKKATIAHESLKGSPSPDVGDIDEVARTFSLDGNSYYIIERFGMDRGYLSQLFATLPDQPAEELEQLEEKLEPELVEA